MRQFWQRPIARATRSAGVGAYDVAGDLTWDEKTPEGCILISEDVLGPEPLGELVNLPNAVTLAGLACTLGWIAGGPAWLAIAGLVADELDGRLARARNEQTRFGSLFDWTADVVSSSLILVRLGRPAMIVPTLLGQIYLRESAWRPPIGSARAGLTLYALATGG